MLPPHQLFGSPNAAGPAGLEDGVKKLFPTETGAPPAGLAAPGEPEDPYENLDRAMLLQRFKDTKADAQDLRWIFERQWWRIILYLLNRQWIFFDARRNEWRDKRLKKWIPKPVTNKLKEVQNSIRAMFASVQMGTITRPNGGDPKNVVTANTVDGLQPLIHKEHKMDERMRLLEQIHDLVTALYGHFLGVRLSPAWASDVAPALRAWVQSGEVMDEKRFDQLHGKRRARA